MKLRLMTMDDAEFMLELKNYPETRQFAIKSDLMILREDHLKWLEQHVQEFKVIVSETKNPVGAVRVHEKEISIWIDRNYWGKGIATKTINTVAEKGHWARIVDGNVGSFRAFTKAGFYPVFHAENYYILRK